MLDPFITAVFYVMLFAMIVLLVIIMVLIARLYLPQKKRLTYVKPNQTDSEPTHDQ